MALSVSLTNSERYAMKETIRSQYKKLIMSLSTTSTLRKELTMRLLQDSINKLADIPDSAYPYLRTIPRDRIGRELNNIKLPMAVSEFDSYDSEFISKKNNLLDIKENDLNEIKNIPAAFTEKGLIPNLLIEFFTINSSYSHTVNKDTIVITDEDVDTITANNETIQDKVGAYVEQLNMLIDTIDSCKSTKMFEAKLPELVNIYPESVLKKIENKNSEITELSEEEMALKGAITSFAAASLISDDTDI